MGKIKIQKIEDVGINTIRDLTKEELIECIEKALENDSSARFWFQRKLLDIADRRRNKKLEEDEAKGNRWIALEKEYNELMKPYAGKKIGDIPMDIINKGAALSKEIRKAQKAYFATFGQY